VLVQQGRRITALHIKQLKASKIKLLAVPDDYVIGKVLSENLVDSETGEIFANANDEITEEMLAMIRDKGFPIRWRWTRPPTISKPRLKSTV
jgi:DNA-directed RNA polymerase subunit beta